MKYTGYIEGYYGKLLSWDERLDIIGHLSQNNLNTYFYCPKEDPYHRSEWKKPYPQNWLELFSNFINVSNQNGINIIFGISPGLNFNKSLEDLFLKIDVITSLGITNIAILFDDLFEDQSGQLHADILNECLNKFPGVSFYCVPAEYCNQLSKPNFNESVYLENLVVSLSSDIAIFWTGDKVVSSNYSNEDISLWKEKLKHPLIIWDNFYANDYCTPKVVIDDFYPIQKTDLSSLEGILINPMGLIGVDKIAISAFSNSINNYPKSFDEILKESDLPETFIAIAKLFKFNASLDLNEKELKILESYLWNWHGSLKTELYPYMHLLSRMIKNGVSEDILLKRFNIS